MKRAKLIGVLHASQLMFRYNSDVKKVADCLIRLGVLEEKKVLTGEGFGKLLD